MKYVLQVSGLREAEFPEGEGPRMEEFIDYQTAIVGSVPLADGRFLDDYQLSTSAQVDGSGERIITNGPFLEMREYLGGWYIVDVPDLDAALEWGARHPGAKCGRVEIRPVLG